MAEKHSYSLCTDMNTKINLTQETDVDDGVRKKLLELEDDLLYDNIFSWKMRDRSTVKGEFIEFRSLNNIRTSLNRQLQMVTYNNGVEQFHLHSFYLKLIVCYELFMNEKRKESLMAIEDLVKSMNSVSFDESNEQYIAAYDHILRSSYAYIALSMNINNYEEIMKNVKPKSEFSCIEQSAIHGIKSLIFKKYPSKAKLIAFNEADKAIELNSDDVQWLCIWLLAKNPLNREYNISPELYKQDIRVAKDLYKQSKTFCHVMLATDVFIHVAKQFGGLHKINKFTDLSFKAIIKALQLAENHEDLITNCLNKAMSNKVLLLPEPIIQEKIIQFHNTTNASLIGCFGYYYHRHKQNYEEAKKFYIRGKEKKLFCVFNLLKIECHLKGPEEIPFIETLMDAYKVFSNESCRIKILSQILIYCTCYKKDQDKIMHYLKMFMDAPFDNTFKYHHFYLIIPLFARPTWPEKYIDMIFNKVKDIITLQTDVCTKERNTMDDTFKKFCNMVMEGNAKEKNAIKAYQMNLENIGRWPE